MDNQGQKQNYGYANPNIGDENISYPGQIPRGNMQYSQQVQNAQQEDDDQEQMPPIYAEKIESVKETTEHQVINFDPIEIGEGEDVANYLQSGQLMKKLAPKIIALKQETQNQGNSDPSVHTEIKFDLKQNAAIYDNPNENNEEGLKSRNDQLNATSSINNNKYSLDQQGNYDMSRTQQFSSAGQIKKSNSGNQEDPNEIKYSSVLPPKFAQTKIVTIDQYGNRHEDEQNIEAEDEESCPIDNDEIRNRKRDILSQNQELEQQRQFEQQLLEKKKLEQQELERQRLLQLQEQRLQQQNEQERIQKQQILLQQQLEQERIKKQQLLQQQRLQQQKIQNKEINMIARPSQPTPKTAFGLYHANSDNNLIQNFQPNVTQRLPNNPNPFQIQNSSSKSPMRNLNRNNPNIPQRDPIVQKVIKLSGTLRRRQKIPINNMDNMNIRNNAMNNTMNIRNNNMNNVMNNMNIRNNNMNNTMNNTMNIRNNNMNNAMNNMNIRNNNMNNTMNNMNIRNNINTMNLNIRNNINNNINNINTMNNINTINNINNINNAKLLSNVLKIQSKWRYHYIKMRFEQIKQQLVLESENFLSSQYEICDKAGPAISDDDFTLEGWKKFYPPNDPFFNFDKGFVLQYGIKIKHPNNPEKVQVYEGDINIKNERHGYGRLTTTKSVFLGEWRNDEFTGWGRETRRSGKILEGKYINGLVEGKGILKNNKGNTYIGDFVNSKRHGKGILDTNKVHYEGEFQNDKLCGKGRIIFKKEGHVYEGEFDNNEINGYGTFKWKNGDSYTGQMKNGKMHGSGRYIYNNGKIFEGTYSNGIKTGKGIIYHMNSSVADKSMISKNSDPKGLNISGMTVNTKFKGGK